MRNFPTSGGWKEFLQKSPARQRNRMLRLLGNQNLPQLRNCSIRWINKLVGLAGESGSYLELTPCHLVACQGRKQRIQKLVFSDLLSRPNNRAQLEASGY